MMYNRTVINTINYSPVYMLGWCGYSTKIDRHSDRNTPYTKIKTCMNWLQENNYIDLFSEKDFVRNNLQTSELNDDLIFPLENFAILYDFEIEEIMKYKPEKPVTKSILLLLLAHIRAYTWVRINEVTGHSKKSKSNKPEIFWSSYEDIADFIGINRQTISNATDILEDLGLIKTYRLPIRKIEGNLITGRIIYICPYKILYENGKFRFCSSEEYNCEQELKLGIEYINKEKFNSKKFRQDLGIKK